MRTKFRLVSLCNILLPHFNFIQQINCFSFDFLRNFSQWKSCHISSKKKKKGSNSTSSSCKEAGSQPKATPTIISCDVGKFKVFWVVPSSSSSSGSSRSYFVLVNEFIVSTSMRVCVCMCCILWASCSCMQADRLN